MSSGKKVYYRDQGITRDLAARYFRQFGDARRILDVGCGTGDLGRFRPRPDTEVYGLDGDPGAVAEAQAHERAQVCDLDSPLPFEDEFFDAVLAKDILEHVSRPWVLSGELHRVMKPGARLVVSVPMAKPEIVWNDYTHIRGFTAGAIRQMLEDLDFDVEAVRRMGGIPGAGRLGLVDAVPALLRLPMMTRFFGASWEVVASRKAAGPA